METSKLKADLFRFATLRSPQLISKERRKLGFVEHPSYAESIFLKEIINEEDMALARQKMSSKLSAFTPFASVEEVKQFAAEVWEFSMWLGKNKNSLSDTDTLTRNKQDVNKLDGQQVIKVWDNVFYDLLTQKNSNVRQACLQLLVAQHFIINEADYQGKTEELKRIANSKVVIPAVFSRKSQNSTANTAVTHVMPAIKQRELAKQNTRNEKLRAEEEIRTLNNIKQDLQELEESYAEDYEVALEKANKEYAERSEEKLEAYKKKVGTIELAESEESIDDKDSQIPEEAVQEFVFDFPKPLSKVYTNRRLRYTTKEFVKTLSLQEGSLTKALDKVEEKIADQKKVASQIVDSQPKKLVINGVKVKTESTSLPTYTISTRLVVTSQGYDLEVYMSFNAGYAGAFFNAADFNIQIGNPTFQSYSVSLQDITILPSNDPNTIFARLKTISFKKGSFRDDLFLIVEGDFQLDNDKSYSFTSKRTHIFRAISGIAEVAIPADLDDDIVHYGINKIGVADYRKVEQELCCYVPGEVSHIENVMAREYKEKMTRQLVRSEDILETSEEREVEDLSDTTTTSKNEVATEISHVLNKDRSNKFGFNTSASGEYFGAKFEASVNGDFSYSQSSTDSDSVARTYAEDVTRRALERVVQKNTVKRTSKILKEFENNNKHGYDNRNGDKHVTGVFRWIDKIYKNQLVNYGKRLMYEFMLPEPARFYKDLIVIEAEANGGSSNNNNGGTTLVEPTHPSAHGISDASSIDRNNYQNFAALYGVSVPAPLKPTEEPTGTVSKKYDSSGDPEAVSLAPIQVPTDYKCVRIEGNGSYKWRNRDLPVGFIEIHAGGIWRRDNPYPGWQPFAPEATTNVSFVRNNLSLTGTINVSYNILKVRQIGVTLKAYCVLKDSVHQQWQQTVYDAIMAEYQQQLNAYNQALAANNNDDAATPEPEDEVLQFNPKYNKQFIINELKRLCIEMLLAPFGRKQGMDFYQNGECDVPQLKLGKNLDAYASQVKFFEQAFDWTILSHIFYPYYWAKKCDWEKLFQSQDSTDHVMQEFLQSGMGRALVPVREGFEDAVIYYMETGELWQGTGLVLDTDDELYLSIVDEVTHVDGKVEEEWETVVPTSLTIIQGKSAYLDDEGLPCCEKEGEPELLPDNNVLQLLEEAK